MCAWVVLEHLKSDDPDFEYRQIGVVDRDGRSAAYTGPGTRGWSGHVLGENYVATGNGLVGPGVVEAIAAGFLAEPNGDLEHRLLMSIEAGRDAGGQGSKEAHKPERSAALSVYSRHAYADKKYEGYYRERGLNPRGAIGQEAFMAQLRAAGA